MGELAPAMLGTPTPCPWAPRHSTDCAQYGSSVCDGMRCTPAPHPESWRRCDDCAGDECPDGCAADQPRDEASDEIEGAR